MSCTSNNPQPSTSAVHKNTTQNAGGGGADASIGMSFHLTIAILMLITLKDLSNADLGFQYHIWLEKKGYGKFDDIVLQYKKFEDEWIQICIQCKSGAENTTNGISKSAKSISAYDLLSGNNKQLSLANYIKSFSEIQKFTKECKTYYVIVTNRAYSSDKDTDYPFFERVNIDDMPVTGILVGKAFKIKYNPELSKHVLDQLKFDKKNVIKVDSKTIEAFCENFLYICDNRQLENVLHEKLLLHCNGNESEMKILEAELYYVVTKMFQHKYEPKQNDFLKIFNGTNIQFKIEPAHQMFTGRKVEIKQIKISCDSKKGNYILDVLVTGMAGMGKTQVVRKYIDENKQNYKNIIWINAESNESLENSFTDLARSCHLIKENSEDGETEIVDVNKAVYAYFSKETLFVFDNADKALLLKSNNGEYIYLPNYEQSTKNKFIVISQSTTWTTNNPIVTLDKYSEEEALLYLDTVIECNKEEKQKIAARVQYWPLALCLAASYIKLAIASSSKRVSDVVKFFQFENENLHKHLPQENEMEPYNSSLRKLWQLIQAKLQEKGESDLPQKILHILSFSSPDNFPIELLKFDSISENQLVRAISLLRDNSLVSVGNFNLSIHRALQAVIRNSIISNIYLYKDVLSQAVDSFNNFLKAMNIYECQKTLGNIHMVTFLNFMNESDVNLQAYVTIAENLLRKLYDSNDLRTHGKQGGIFDQILLKASKDLSDNCETTLRLMSIKALMLEKLGKYDEALSLNNKILEIIKVKFRKSYPKTVFIMNNKASVLHHLGKYNEALTIINEVIEEKTVQFGKDHSSTLYSLDIKALVLEKLQKYKEVLNIYIQQLVIRTVKLGKDHPQTLNSKVAMASVLAHMEKYDEAVNMYNEVLGVQKVKLGEDHPDTLSTMHSKAAVLHKMEKYDDALSIYDEVIEKKTEKLGIDHPHVLASLHNKASVLHSMGKYDHALSVCNEVIDIEKKMFGKDHPSTLNSLNYKASVLNEIGKYEEALSIYNQVIMTDRFGKFNTSIIKSMHNKSYILYRMRKYDEALLLCNQVIEISSEMLGKDHSTSLSSMNNKAFVLVNMGNYAEALNVFNQLIDLETEKLGKNHPQTAASIGNKAILLDIMNYKEQRSGNFLNRVFRRIF